MEGLINIVRKHEKNGAEKQAPFSLPATSDVVSLVNRVRRKYVKAVVALHPNDDEDEPLDANLGDSQILRAGLIVLDLTLDLNKPKEVVKVIDRAKKRRGPHIDQSSDGDSYDTEDKAPDTSPRNGAAKAAGTRRS